MKHKEKVIIFVSIRFGSCSPGQKIKELKETV